MGELQNITIYDGNPFPDAQLQIICHAKYLASLNSSVRVGTAALSMLRIKMSDARTLHQINGGNLWFSFKNPHIS